jgi:LCP family protein required for cell wall assembly
MYVVVCAGALLVGTVSGWLNSSKIIRENGGIWGMLHPKDPTEVFQKDSINLLILGCDEDRVTGGASTTRTLARSDMMLLAHLDFKTKSITGVSIPRDTWVRVPSYDGSKHKINAFHSYGGKPLAKLAVETLLPGVHVDKVVTLNFDGFQEMVNLVGGVPVEVDKNMDYVDHAGHLAIHLKKGMQVLNGENAMGFVRFRHSDSDYAREDRQHRFMLAFKEALMHHPNQLPNVIDATARMLSDGLSDQEVNALGHFVNDASKANIHFGQVPVIDNGRDVDPNTAKIPGVLREFGFLPSSGAVTHA